MIKMVIAGVWTCVILLGAMYGSTLFGASHAGAAPGVAGAAAAPPSGEVKRTPEIEVPMIADGKLQGYIVARFSYTLNAKAQSAVSVAPEPFLLDEAFRAIYDNPTLDFSHIQKVDLTKLTKDLIQNVNTHLQANVVQDILVEEFNYVSKEDMSK